MVTYLKLAYIPLLICPEQFAAICELTNLEELDIEGVGFDEADRVCSISTYCVKALCCILCSNLLGDFCTAVCSIPTYFVKLALLQCGPGLIRFVWHGIFCLNR
jgi:hypothetical protein